MHFSVHVAPWGEFEAEARAVREAVFIKEQKVPLELEWDAMDAGCVHVVARDQTGAAIGTGRLLPDGRIGRVAVLSTWRGRGVGRSMLQTLIAEARRRGFAEAVLSAQTQARQFYEKNGFAVAGEAFMEAGIPHVSMVRKLT